MATHLVNLDALITREDFQVKTDGEALPGSKKVTLSLGELEETKVMYSMLRKPDFQRETSNWNPAAVMDLVKSFVDGDLIPSVILWRSPETGRVFVIDGAHRLSALIAWVQNDYGDGRMSQTFFSNFIPPEQKEAAERSRKLIKQTIGSYEDIKQAGLNPQNSPPISVKRAQNASLLQIDLQWVDGNASKAEESFFKINQKAVAIHKIELRVLQSRRQPISLATRSLVHAGVGHKYWSTFPKETQSEIESIAREVYLILFDPPMETPVKSLDLPIAGRAYSAAAFQMIFEFVTFCSKGEKNDIINDTDGSNTLSLLKRIRSAAIRISGNDDGALGLHPVVYFYSATGRFQPSAFLAVVEFIDGLNKDDVFEFTSVRAKFEDFLIKYRFFINQIVRKYGSSTKASPKLVELYRFLFNKLKQNLPNAEIVKELLAYEPLKFLKEDSEYEKTEDADFGTEQKNAVFLKTIETAPKCQICAARIHKKSFNIDHITRKQDGGTGDSENGQLAHFYCNSGYKEKLAVLAANR